MSFPHYNHYSQHARDALTQSHYIARYYGHHAVDTDHLFMGILSTKGSLAWQVLRDLGLDLAEVSAQAQDLHPSSPNSQERLPFTLDLRDALILAVSEAQALTSPYVGTEHILLGLIRSSSEAFRELLSRLDLSPAQFRGRIKRLIQQGISEITLEAVREMARLSELAKRVLNSAGQIAASYQQKSLAPQHLLLALSRERRSVARRLLTENACNVDMLLADIEKIPAYSPELELHLNQIINRAVDRAEAMGSHYTGTEHLLLAMTLDPASQTMLQRYDVDIDTLQMKLYASLKA